MPYQITVEQRRTHIHAKVVGERTAENALRFLRESYAACVNSEKSALLIEMCLSGPSLTTTSVFEVISSWVADALKLRKIAYVEALFDDVAMPAFLETVAVNRGANVRLFRDVGSAESWLSEVP
jgi:hypothetical protein